MKVKYIGPNVKTDSIVGVGLQWTPGQERDVTSTVAEHLLAYPDTWVKAEGEINKHDNEALGPVAVEAGRKEEPVDFLEKDTHVEEPLAVVDFHSMSKDEMLKYGEEKYGFRQDKKLREDLIRERLIKKSTEHDAEDKLR